MRNDVRNLRTAEGMSQGELAQVMAVSRQTINAIETERYTPSLPLAINLPKFFELSVEEVFDATGTNIEPPQSTWSDGRSQS